MPMARPASFCRRSGIPSPIATESARTGLPPSSRARRSEVAVILQQRRTSGKSELREGTRLCNLGDETLHVGKDTSALVGRENPHFVFYDNHRFKYGRGFA